MLSLKKILKTYKTITITITILKQFPFMSYKNKIKKQKTFIVLEITSVLVYGIVIVYNAA